ncbi:MAG: hypothetical protein AUK47_25290 [Deltaproteobacteria bacterium CG2_30_63_29]|nr:MAG: hypothetical protein AUK47_25290 [Deltaproteobacteria bacterium CG2_30_63_29]PIV99233.1 MAG: hypothetical protein COW42_11670 [Deltaproteobacteria bacterium CG17_big_fil_post_rev_8_21_14_2_50_63_7]PJB40279.1 MAG: hypothetical protein CO108_15205 [Deltaproteobacteria bacterium CG_4_9_14_3_um_filter_63_12]
MGEGNGADRNRLEEKVIALCEEHLERYPDMEAVDLYTLLHQFVNGPKHLLANRQAAKERLARELAELDLEVREWEDVVEMLDEDRQLARIYLRPYLRSGGDATRLYHAMCESAAQMNGAPAELEWVLSIVSAALKAERFEEVGFEVSDFRATLSQAKDAGFIALSHSKTYRDEYQPVYRVVLLSTLA